MTSRTCERLIEIRRYYEESDTLFPGGVAPVPPEAVVAAADFFYRAMQEAIGFLGSECERLLADTKGKRIDGRMAQIRRVAQDVLAHLGFETRGLAGVVRGFRSSGSPTNANSRSISGRRTPWDPFSGTGSTTRGCRGGPAARRCTLIEVTFEEETRSRKIYFDWVERLR
jgi:hypothetical protein